MQTSSGSRNDCTHVDFDEWWVSFVDHVDRERIAAALLCRPTALGDIAWASLNVTLGAVTVDSMNRSAKQDLVASVLFHPAGTFIALTDRLRICRACTNLEWRQLSLEATRHRCIDPTELDRALVELNVDCSTRVTCVGLQPWPTR